MHKLSICDNQQIAILRCLMGKISERLRHARISEALRHLRFLWSIDKDHVPPRCATTIQPMFQKQYLKLFL
jgi:hypothetical protein